MTLFFKQEDEEDKEDDTPDEIARDLEEQRRIDEDVSEGLDTLEDAGKETEVEQQVSQLETDLAKKRRRKPARDIRVLNNYLADMKTIKESGTVEDGVYDSLSRNTFKKISKANINILIDKMVYLQRRRKLLEEQPYQEFIIDGKFRIGEELVDVKKLQREYTELGADSEFLDFLQGLYMRRFNGDIPPSLVDKPKTKQQLNRLISSIVIGDPTTGIVRQREILEDMLKAVNRSLFAFTELTEARENLTKQIDDLETLVDADLQILIDKRLKALALAYSTVQRKVAEYVAQRLPDITDDKDRTRVPYRGLEFKRPKFERTPEEEEQQRKISEDIERERKKETARLERYKRDAKKRRELRKSDPYRELIDEAKEKVRVKLGDTSRRLTQAQIEEMLDDLKSAQPEILEEAKEDIRKEIESQLEIEKRRLIEIENKLKTVDKYRPLFREAKSLVGEYTGKEEIFKEQVILGNKVKIAAQGLREIESIMRQLNKENEQSLEEWIEGAEKSVVIDLNKYGKLGAGIGDTTPKEVRLVGELVERVNTRFDSLQEQINIVKNKLDTQAGE